MKKSLVSIVGLGILAFSSCLLTDARAVRLSAVFVANSLGFSNGGTFNITLTKKEGELNPYFIRNNINIKPNARIGISDNVQINYKDYVYYYLEYEKPGTNYVYTQFGLCDQVHEDINRSQGMRIVFENIPGKNNPLIDKSPWFKCKLQYSP